MELEQNNNNMPDSYTVILDPEQYQSIIDQYNALSNQVGQLRQDVSHLNNSGDESAKSVVVPDDFYTFTADALTVCVFFLSILSGLLLGFIFVFGLNRNKS